MRRRLRILAFVSVLLAAVAAAGLWWHWPQIQRQYAGYRVGAAPRYEEARRRLAWFEEGKDPSPKLRALVRKWGGGNAQFDRYLARYVDDPASSESLREAFSRNLAWRAELLPRWAHWWRWRPGPAPDERMRSILAYLELLAATDGSKALTWREVLDVQAIFALTGQADLAARLTPENWRDRYRQWRKQRPDPLPRLTRPDAPLPAE